MVIVRTSCVQNIVQSANTSYSGLSHLDARAELENCNIETLCITPRWDEI